jgi:hypothetical protein
MSHTLDFLEGLRKYWYPRLHGLLTSLGVAGLEGRRNISENAYVCTVSVSEDAFEKELLHGSGFQRNLLAKYKTRPDGPDSTLSLRKVYDSNDMQLHVTVFPSTRRSGALDLYAHYEKDWAEDPRGHLRGKSFSVAEGRARTLAALRDDTYFAEGEDYEVLDQ